MRIDIYCRVVDNYGDIGVSWRLARQLVHEHGATVRLWVDDFASLNKLCAAPECEGVTVLPLECEGEPISPGDVVIEAFGCGLPTRVVASMAAASKKPLWIVLEYLSAEHWVREFHALPSPHPQHAIPRYFYFPGFSPDTGGIICENDLLARRDAFERDAWLLANGMAPLPRDALTASLFAYPTAAHEEWLAACAAGEREVVVLVPDGTLAHVLRERWGAGAGALQLRYLPFAPQLKYDELLWACDVNFVRGEDSFVRAQWTGKPWVWNIYPQQAQAHVVKLEAFLELISLGSAQSWQSAQFDFWRSWNRVPGAPTTGRAWQEWLRALPDIQAAARVWPARLKEAGELTANLLRFCQKLI